MTNQSSQEALHAIAELLGTRPTPAMVVAALEAAYSLGRCDQVIEFTKAVQNDQVVRQ
jgi:hypothetical protein